MGMNKMVVGEIQEVDEVEETLLTRSFSFSSSSSSSSSSSLMVINEDDGNNEAKKKTMPLLALNHVSFVCKSLIRSVEFYEQVLGFVLIKRPSSFDFQGAWLFNHGIGIHLLEADNIPAGGGKIKGKKRINPKDNHISFQCTNMELIMQKLEEMKIEYVTAVVKEGGITVDQLFFHDPDGYMIEICNCQNLPLLPLLPSSSSSCPLIKKMPLPIDHSSSSYEINAGKATVKMQCCAKVEALMMERLAIEMMNICF